MDRTGLAEVYGPAARQALRAFAITPSSLELISLSENVTFRVTDQTNGAAYGLRLHRPGYHSLEELCAERIWVRALAEAGIATPVAVLAADGRDYVPVSIAATGEQRFVGMTHWIAGEPLDAVLAVNGSSQSHVHWFGKLGAMMASLHGQSSAWRPPEGFRRHALDSEGLMGEAPFWGRFWEHAGLTRGEQALLLSTRARVRAALDRLPRTPDSFGMIHSDLHPANLIVDADRLTAIDFDDAAFGWFVSDLAAALVGCQDRDDFPALQAALVDGYRAQRPIAEATLALIPLFLLIRGLSLLGWMHQRPEVDWRQRFAETRQVVCRQCEAFQDPF